MGQKETSKAWFMKGFLLPRRDKHRGENEGLGQREIDALDEENTRPYGMSWYSNEAVKKRGKKARGWFD